MALALLSVAWTALIGVTLLARASEQRTATYKGIREVRVDPAFERVDVVSGDAEKVALTRSYTWSLGRPHLRERVKDHVLLITSSCPWSMGLGCSGSIELSMPPGTRLRVRGSDGAVTLRALTGAIDVATSDGSITAEGLRGPVRLHTSDGSITGTALHVSRIDAQTSDGSVNLTLTEPPRQVTALTQDGSVRVLVPHVLAAYAVDTATSDGGRTVDVATNPASSRTIRAQTSDGDVLVGYSD